MEQFLPIIIQAIAGGAGGGILGQILKSKSLGPLGNIIAGAVGGIGAGQGLDASGIMAQMAPMLGGDHVATAISSLIGGGVLQAIGSLVAGKKTA
ncbi:hypothetical protein [Govanella unica]|uniref:DNA methyltransferase n=1 Tax=Govanella unica TaxID=2975056 RepID=A0A9X3Z7J8_9PROT|nr:hypothetical protein [Govania unica]MDA5194237.1 hypothetical protein [Govania unica]